MIREQLTTLATDWVTRFPFLRLCPELLKRIFRRHVFKTDTLELAKADPAPLDGEYEVRLAKEREIFSDQVNVHDLPEIFHYWSNKYLRPTFEQFGFSNPDEFFAKYLRLALIEHDADRACFASIGSGNCDTEIRVARLLRDSGHEQFSLECIDINSAMLERGRESALEAGVSENLRFSLADFNAWQPNPGSYAAIMANQSLHHVVELEQLFGNIETALTPGGRFLTSDMIGRNGHMRWPEALEIVHEFWRELPESRRWNFQLQRLEELHENWDCSKEGFEGIRSQDILPLLRERFAFELFLPYGNVIDPFVDRGFGGHFDPDDAADRNFIDRIHLRDECEIRAGTITPTHMIATMRKRAYTGACANPEGLTPSFCARDPQRG